jgi:hypothetical protein
MHSRCITRAYTHHNTHENKHLVHATTTILSTRTYAPPREASWSVWRPAALAAMQPTVCSSPRVPRTQAQRTLLEVTLQPEGTTQHQKINAQVERSSVEPALLTQHHERQRPERWHQGVCLYVYRVRAGVRAFVRARARAARRHARNSRAWTLSAAKCRGTRSRRNPERKCQHLTWQRYSHTRDMRKQTKMWEL